MENKSTWYVYLLECGDGTTYIGITTDVERRAREHNQGRGARYTRGRQPIAVLGALSCASRGEALRLEHRLKMLGPAKRRKAFENSL